MNHKKIRSQKDGFKKVILKKPNKINLLEWYIYHTEEVNLDLKLLKICHPTMKIMISMIINVKGLSHKKLQLPSLIKRDLLRFSSISPTKTKARIRGGIGKSYNLKTVATTAIPIII